MKRILFLLGVVGCASGQVDYTAPVVPVPPPNSAVLDVSLDTAWGQIIPRLGKSFFVINTLDRPNLINISYSGDPEAYVDCGMLRSTVQEAGKEPQHYEFPAAQAHSVYEVVVDKHVYGVTRTMDLEGRINIVLEAAGRGRTILTVNTRYVLSKTHRFSDGSSLNESLSFNTGGNDRFPEGQTRCYANGALEAEVLKVLIAGG